MSEPHTSAVGSVQPRQGTKHLYEIDVIRAVTALTVVGVHVVAFTVILTNSPLGELAQYAVLTALHFCREVFLSVSAFVLVFVYANRPFSTKTFWRKRGIAILFPYVAWSFIYEWEKNKLLHLSPLRWTERFALDLVTGNASIQLYFILLTLEFYLILPWFLRFIRRAAAHPWWILGLSLEVQLSIFAIDYFYLQVKPFNGTPLGQFINTYQIDFLPLYQFYLVIGGLAALYLPELRAFVLRHGAWIIAAVVLTLAILLGDLWYETDVTHLGPVYGTSVFQPAMPLYALAMCAFLYWISYRWANGRAPQPPRGYKFWGLLSSISFGIYLMHIDILYRALNEFLPRLPEVWPEPLRVLLTYIVVAGVTCTLCTVMLYTPILSRFIGHPCALPRDRGIGAWVTKASSAALQVLQRITTTVLNPVSAPRMATRVWSTTRSSNSSAEEPHVLQDTLPKAAQLAQRRQDTTIE